MSEFVGFEQELSTRQMENASLHTEFALKQQPVLNELLDRTIKKELGLQKKFT
jgi:hypothetical protein